MLALEHIRVLDLSRLAPGPFGSMLLADMGADVLLVEAPPARLRSNFPRQAEDEAFVAAHNVFSRNKRSIVLDLSTDDARRVFYKLAESADVVMEGFRPGVVKRLGVDYETLRSINDRIVYCSVSGFGQDGPYASLVGHDINYIAIGGALGMIGMPGGPPAIPMNIIADFAGGGLYAAFGILVALMARQQTGKGQYVDIAMSDGVTQLLAIHLSDYFRTGIVPLPGAASLNGAHPFYSVYECADGKWISIGSLEPHFFANLCRLTGNDDLIEHQRDESRFPLIRQRFTELFRTRSRDEWFEALRSEDTCAAPIYTLDEVVNDPHVRHRGMIVELDAPGVGKVKQVGISAKLSETPGSVRHIAPVPGQHTDEVLRSLDYSAADIERLRTAGAVA